MTSTDTRTKKKKKGGGGRGFAYGGGGRRRFSCNFLSLAGAAWNTVFVATKVLYFFYTSWVKKKKKNYTSFVKKNKKYTSFVKNKNKIVAAPTNDNIYALHIDE